MVGSGVGRHNPVPQYKGVDMAAMNWIEIDLDAIAENLAAIRREIGAQCRLCPVIKADAYGLGVDRVLPVMIDAGVSMVAVYDAADALKVAETSGAPPVLVLGPVRSLEPTDPLLAFAAAGRVHFCVHDLLQLEALDRAAAWSGCVISVHLAVDSGMGREGAVPGEASELLRRIDASSSLHLAGVSSHLSSAGSDGEVTRAQWEIFDHFLAAHAAWIDSDVVVHLANSAAVFRDKSYHQSMVRVGLSWCGLSGLGWEGSIKAKSHASLHPVMRWHAKVSQVKRLPIGAPVGYSGRWRAARPTVLGIVPVGYAHGYPMRVGAGDCAAGHAVVRVGAEKIAAPVVGVISMDQMAVDLTDIAPTLIRPGLGIEIVGTDAGAGNRIEQLAALGGWTVHEFLCRLSGRVLRRYCGRGVAVEVVAKRSARPAAG
jgi:alanine racemase